MEKIRLPEGFRLVRFEAAHLPEALDIERASFSEPWSAESFSRLFLPGTATSYALACLSPDGRLAAYGGVQYILDEAEILNIATSPDFRRLGLGRALMTGFDDFFASRGITRVFLEVRASNDPAHSLYLGCGYRDVGVRKNYYTSPTEDAIIMLKDIM